MLLLHMNAVHTPATQGAGVLCQWISSACVLPGAVPVASPDFYVDLAGAQIITNGPVTVIERVHWGRHIHRNNFSGCVCVRCNPLHCRHIL
jgi:hypothetical protein